VCSTILPPPGTQFNLLGVQPGPPVLSPDGRRLAFAALEEDGAVRLWVHELDAGQARPLPGTENGSYPFWAPDGRHLGFFADARLKRIDTDGGLPLSLAEAPYGKGGTWSEDGVILFAPHWNGSIHRVQASGGEAVAVTEIEARGEISGHRAPQFLPDGRHFIYLARTARIGDNTLRVASLDGSTDRPVLEDSQRAVYAAGHLFFRRQASLMARPFDPAALEFTGDPFLVAERVRVIPGASWTMVSAADDGTLVYIGTGKNWGSELIWLDGEGRPAGTVGERAAYDRLALSPDGKSVAVTINDVGSGNVDIWVYDLDRGVPNRFTVDPALDSDPVWSPDGEQIVYRSTRDGGEALFLKDRHGAGAARKILETGNEAILPHRITPDGRHLVYTVSNRGSQADIWILPLDGSEDPSPFLARSFNEAMADFSPDGRWIAYSSDESGRWEIYATRFPDKGAKLRISTGGGINPAWHPEGGKLFYQTENGLIMRVDVRPDGESLSFGTPELYAQQVTEPGSGLGLTGEQVLAISNVPEGEAPVLTLVTGWRPEVKP
jgi:Tol biopolymer transport system component